MEKQIKVIKNQGEKQIKAIEEHIKQQVEPNALVKKIAWHLQKEIFSKLIHERRDEILELSKKSNYDDLAYHFKGRNIS